MVETVGHYRILEPAGSGPLGDVYRARDTRVGRTVSVTVVTEVIATNPDRRQQFLREAHAAAALSHPNIVMLYEVGEDSDLLYLVHEFVQGQSLKTIIAGRPLNLRRAVDLASQVAEGLADAHAAEQAHGALTADTVVITPRGHAKITNFGMAAFLGRATAATTTSIPQGEFAAQRSDLIALGVILFEMLTGAAPSPGAGVPSAINRSLPRAVDPIVARSLGLRGGYEAAATLAAELRALGAMLDVQHEAQEAAVTIVKPRSRAKPPYVVWIALALALAGIAAWWYFSAA
jgi:serine/threonine-protein kinase